MLFAMKGYGLACAAALMVSPALAGDAHNTVMLLHGHPIYNEDTQMAGVAMGLSISGSEFGASPLAAACRELQRLSDLHGENDDGLELATLFIVPYKDMAVEGFYLPADGSFGSRALVKGKQLDRSTIRQVVAPTGIPESLLGETKVELEISCQFDEPVWTVAWQDIRTIGDQGPEATIEQARARFMSIYRTVVQNASGVRNSAAEWEAAPEATN